MEFGGGLGRFSINPKIENRCREIVEVPGGSEWKIRKFQEQFHHFCWKYSGSSVIINYHLNRIQNPESENQENQSKFYAKVSHFMSPVEISLQPKYLSSARKSLMTQLNATYNFSPPDQFCEDQIFISVACAVRELGIWYRGRISQLSGKEHVVVELVDFGTQILVPRHQIFPLFRKFGRAPPLCLKCKVDGLTINDLEIKDLHEFKDIISSCNALFRVEIKSMEEPFLIDLYHPTISNLNVCQKFFPPPEDTGKMDRYARSWERHCRKMNEDFDEDVDLDYDEEFGDGDHENRQKFLVRLPKSPKAPRFESDEMLIEHIENSQLIYLQYPWQAEKRAALDRRLRATWHLFPRLQNPDQMTCAVRNPRGTVCRGILDEDGDTVLLVDYGRFVKRTKEVEVRMLPAEFADEPMVTIISLVRGANLQTPHHSETEFLRKMLPRGTKCHFRWDGKSKTIPMRGRLILKGHSECLNNQMVDYLKNSKIDARCRQLDIYRPRESHVLPRGNHVYRATCHPNYAKGNVEFI